MPDEGSTAELRGSIGAPTLRPVRYQAFQRGRRVIVSLLDERDEENAKNLNKAKARMISFF